MKFCGHCGMQLWGKRPCEDCGGYKPNEVFRRENMKNNFWIEQREKRYISNVKKENMSEDSRVALLAENQRLYNAQYSSNAWFNDIYGRVAIATVKKVFDPANFLALKLISMQPMLGPAGIVKYFRFRYSAPKNNPVPSMPEGTIYCNKEICDGDDLPDIRLVEEKEDCIAKTRKMKLEFPLLKMNPDSNADGFLRYYDNFYLTKDFANKYVDVRGPREFMEDEMADYMANNLIDEIHAEILTDLRNNAGTVATFDYATALGDTIKEKYESFYIKIVEVSGVIHRKTLRGGANWIVTSPEIAELFTNACHWGDWKGRDNSELCYHGTMNNRWRLYSSKSAQRGTMLLGYKGDVDHDSGYFYNPYIPLTPAEKMPDPDTRMISTGTLSRYSKKLLREGAKFYARINVKGF